MALFNLQDRLFTLMQETSDVGTACGLRDILQEISAIRGVLGEIAPLPWRVSDDFEEGFRGGPDNNPFPVIMSGDKAVVGTEGFFMCDGTDEANAKLCVEAVNLLFG